MNMITFNSANFVGRELGYVDFDGTPPSWREAARVTEERFAPIESFGARFAGILDIACDWGLHGVDLWTGHLNPSWVTPDHLAIARDALEARDLRIMSIGGRMGDTREEFDRACRVAEGVGARVWAGMSSLPMTDSAWALSRLEQGDLRFGHENHPERTPEELLRRIPADGDGRIGVTVDTGWWGSQGYDAARAIEEFGDRVVYVHLKDVREAGSHMTCRFGDGVVPIEDCVGALRSIGYAGPVSVEHEPSGYDPTTEVRDSIRQLEAWLETGT